MKEKLHDILGGNHSFLNQGFLEAFSHMRIIPNISIVHNCQLMQSAPETPTEGLLNNPLI